MLWSNNCHLATYKADAQPSLLHYMTTILRGWMPPQVLENLSHISWLPYVCGIILDFQRPRMHYCRAELGKRMSPRLDLLIFMARGSQELGSRNLGSTDPRNYVPMARNAFLLVEVLWFQGWNPFQNRNYSLFCGSDSDSRKTLNHSTYRGVLVLGLESILESDLHHGCDSDSGSDSSKNGIRTPLEVTQNTYRSAPWMEEGMSDWMQGKTSAAQFRVWHLEKERKK